MECSICTSSDVEENAYVLPLEVSASRLIETPVHRCRNCGVHFRGIDYDSSEVGEHFDVVRYVRQSNEEALGTAREHFFEYLLSEAIRELRTAEGKKLLDIGCSYGHMMRLFEAKGGFRVCGVERNAVLREHLAREGCEVFETVGEVEDGGFDIITLIDSLYYFQTPLNILKQVRTLLNDDGIVILRITNRVWLANIYRSLGRCVPYFCMGDAKYSFTYSGIQHLLQNAGFAISRVIVTERGKKLSSKRKWLFYKCTQLIDMLGIARISPGLILICRTHGGC